MPLTRRELLKGIGVVAGALGIGAAGYERLVPYIHQPDDVIPGVSTWYATSCRECPAGCGMLMRGRESRVVKCEGNPDHPISHGKLCARGQAAMLGLYDPDRIPGPQRRTDSGQLVSAGWDDAYKSLGEIFAKRPRIAFLSDLQTGSLNTLMGAWLSALGSSRLLIYEPINYEDVKSAVGRATGTPLVPVFDLAGSDYLISFAADFLETWISPVDFAWQYAEMRRIRNGTRGRFVYVGPRVSMTAANADQRMIVPPGTEYAVALAILSESGRAGAPAGFSADAIGRTLGIDPNAIRRVAKGLATAKMPLALPGGDAQSAASAMLLNAALGSTGVDTNHPHAVTYAASRAEMGSLIRDMESGAVDVLVVSGANPAYAWPEAARVSSALKRVPLVISLSSFLDETSALSHWILPSNTPLESWGDYAPQAGIANLMQPTMGTLLNTRQTGDILIELARAAGIDPRATFQAGSYYEYLRRRWNAPLAAGESPETPSPAWESLMQRGGRWSAPDAAPAGRSAVFALGEIAPPKPSDGLRLWAYPSIYLYDGRNANQRWLQELPEPVVKGVWGTWAELHPSTARKLGVGDNDLIRIAHGDASIEAPVYIWEGVEPGTVAVPIGEGHTEYGRFAKNTGANVWPLLSAANPVVTLKPAGGSKTVVRLAGSEELGDRDDIVLATILGEPVERAPINLPLKEGYTKKDFYPGHEHPEHRWAMVIDTNRCIGCHACVSACYAENNVAVVGADEVWRHRVMAWLRVDNYVDWKRSSAPILFQPMLCQHCDAAPCEPVCPVYAAVHSPDGINEQIYNRCVGTRYCSNNCPYKVRRFNWFHHTWPEPLNYQLNPDATVRDRGVMEKCTFCVQRIREAGIVARREGRALRDGEVTPACAQTCPTGVYTFGDLKDPNSRVSQLVRTDPRAYQVLQHLNTKPGVIYLKRVVEGT